MITVEQTIAGLETIVNYNDRDEFLMKRIRPAIALLRQQSRLREELEYARGVLLNRMFVSNPVIQSIDAVLAEVPQK